MIKIIKLVGLSFLLLLAFAFSNAYAHPAWGIVVDNQKQVYFSDLETIWKIDQQGKLSIFREGESGRHVHDLTIDAEGNLYGSDLNYNQLTQKFPRSIWKMTPGGEFSYIISPTEDLPSGASIWRDSSGNTYSVEPYNNEKKETKIIKRSPDGQTIIIAGGKYGYLDGKGENAQFTVVTDLVFGRDNTIFLTNDDKIRKIDQTGTVTTLYREENPKSNPNNLEPFSRLFGLAVDQQNNVLAADFYNNRLIKISPNGKITTVVNSEKEWSPVGVATNNNEIYVLEARPYSAATHSGNRVVKISADGKPTTIATMEEAVKPKEPENSAVNLAQTGNAKSSTDSAPPNNWLVILGILGAVGVAFAAFIILVKRK